LTPVIRRIFVRYRVKLYAFLERVKMELKKLFEPVQIGTMRIKNRIVMPAMDTNLATTEGFVTARMIDYYAERARGGVGLIIVECTSIDYPRGKVTVGQLSIDDDRYLEGLSQLANAIKSAGACAAIQLEHGGGVTHSAISGEQPVGPSESISPLGEPVRALSSSEIAELVDLHAQAALRAKKAGFDGIEVHGAHEHLLAQFLSPSINQRQDEYGGTLENRARFLLEVVRACRSAVGGDYPLWCRIDSAEYGVDPAINYLDAIQVAQWAEAAGANAIHVSGHGYGVQFTALCPGMPGFHLTGASEVRRNVNVPVIAVGRIYPQLGEWALREGMADMIAMGRELIADPHLPRKAAEDREKDIVPCIGCWECVEGSIQAVVQSITNPGGDSSGEIGCSVNPAAGREADIKISPSQKRKRVVVVGGGPAGMETARVAGLRKHSVTLIEKDSGLGGQLIPGAVPPHKETISLLVDYYITQLAKLGVDIRLGKEATMDDIVALNPDEVVWAAGAIPTTPNTLDLTWAKPVYAADVLTGKAAAGDKIIIIGGDGTGCETANALAGQDRKVTILEILPQVLSKEGTIVQMRLLDELARKNIEILTGITYEGSGPDGLTIKTIEGKTRTLKADTYVLATGSKSNSDLLPALRKKFRNVHVIGDAVEPRRIRDAIAEGFKIGNLI
jgi:2,4-dienoyl-CoA reductase-like NADH-dependent reductase (Old Yellow Enzyme family)/thioredoxin reductase